MHGTVDLDRQGVLRAEEIEDVGAEGVLASEREAIELAAAEVAPEEDFGEGHLAAEVSRGGRWIGVPA